MLWYLALAVLMMLWQQIWQPGHNIMMGAGLLMPLISLALPAAWFHLYQQHARDWPKSFMLTWAQAIAPSVSIAYSGSIFAITGLDAGGLADLWAQNWPHSQPPPWVMPALLLPGNLFSHFCWLLLAACLVTGRNPLVASGMIFRDIKIAWPFYGLLLISLEGLAQGLDMLFHGVLAVLVTQDFAIAASLWGQIFLGLKNALWISIWFGAISWRKQQMRPGGVTPSS